MALPLILFVLFALLAAAGLFLIVRHHHGPRPALVWSVLLLLGFAALGWWVLAMIRASGLG